MWGWGILGSFSPGSLHHVVEVLTLLLLVVFLFLHDGCPLSTLCLHVYRQGLGDDNNDNDNDDDNDNDNENEHDNDTDNNHIHKKTININNNNK